MRRSERLSAPKRTFTECSADLPQDRWISASNIRNYMLDDSILDYFEISALRERPAKKRRIAEHTISLSENKSVLAENKYTNFNDYLCKRGIEFEAEVIAELKRRHGALITQIASSFQQSRCAKVFAETRIALKCGQPIIYQGVLQAPLNKILCGDSAADITVVGMPDLIVREDYLDIFGGKAKKQQNKKKIKYVVIDIKSSQILLCADGEHVRNSAAAMRANKAQIFIYNVLLNCVMGGAASQKCAVAYVYGRAGSNAAKKNNRYQIGRLDFAAHDAAIADKARDALAWRARLLTDFDSIDPADLRPNMKNKQDSPWHCRKLELAEESGELTSLWMVGVKARAEGIDRGIYSWHDKRCTAAKLGFGAETKRGVTLDAILCVNRSKKMKYFIGGASDAVRRVIISHRGTTEFFVDFETADVEGQGHVIFMIGLYFKQGRVTRYVNFCADRINTANEKRLIQQFQKFIHNNAKKYRIYHWSSAETSLYRKACKKYKLRGILVPAHWCDLLAVFHTGPIVVKGALNFSLKSIAQALFDQRLINDIYDPTAVIKDGAAAMIHAINAERRTIAGGLSLATANEIKDIAEYNEYDCRILYEILNRFLRVVI
jgi:predicted RecB family nuclease